MYREEVLAKAASKIKEMEERENVKKRMSEERVWDKRLEGKDKKRHPTLNNQFSKQAQLRDCIDVVSK